MTKMQQKKSLQLTTFNQIALFFNQITMFSIFIIQTELQQSFKS